MGQRHQFFAIAKINNRYRTIAVVHNQFLYGASAVRQCLHAMRIFGAAGNLPGIKRELQLARSKPESFWQAKPKTKGDADRGIDFPFMTTCLMLGCGVAPNGHNSLNILELSIDERYDGVDNDDGISVFDVTELGHPRYAMIPLYEYEGVLDDDLEVIDASNAFHSDAFLNASDYMLPYQQNYSDHLDEANIKALDEMPQVTVDALKSAWPYGDFYLRRSTDNSNGIADAYPSKNTTKSLMESSVRTVIERALQCDLSDLGWLLEAEQVSGFTDSLRTYLYAYPDAVRDRPAIILLGRALKGYIKVDLHPFSHLTCNDIIALVDIIAESRMAFSLTLPDLDDLTATDLRRLLSNGLIWELRIGKHQVENLGDLINAIDGTSIRSFVAPELYSRGFAPAHHDILRNDWQCAPWISPVPSLPRPQQFPITQLVFIQWPAVSMTPASVRGNSVTPWSDLLNTENLRDAEPEDPILSLPMNYYFISAAEGIKRLPTFVSHLAQYRGSGPWTGSMILGLLRQLSLKDDLTVNPMPGELTAFAKRQAARSPAPYAPTLPLKRGEYTIVLLHEHTWKEDPEHPFRLRYGFATLDPEDKIQVLSAEAFAHAYEPATRAAEISQEWGRESAGLCETLQRKHREMAKRLPGMMGSRGTFTPRSEVQTASEDSSSKGCHATPDLRLEVCSSGEIDELFKGLAACGRLVNSL